MNKGLFFWFQCLLTITVSAFLTVPIFLTVLTALTANAFKGLSSGLTLKWVGKVIETYGDTISRSFCLALLTLSVCLALGIPAAYGLVRAGKKSWAVLLEESLVLPLSIPGIAIGLGILITWGGVEWFRHSLLFLLSGHVIFCLPFMVRSLTAVMRVIPLRDYVDSAATLGAGPVKSFFWVVVPSSLPGIISGSLQVLTLSVGEFNISWMLQTPFIKTLPVGLADTYASMRIEIGSAYTLIFFILIVPLLAVMQKIPSFMEGRHKSPGGILKASPMSQSKQIAPAFRPAPVPIRLENCSKTFGSARVLEPLSLDVPEGRKVVLLGPSGCGKTTTLRLIAGLESPDPGGRLFLGGQEVTNLPPEKRGIGMMFQSYALFPHLSVAENVAFGLKAKKTPKGESAALVSRLLEMARLEGLGQSRVGHLSGGQKQRVALIRALAPQPRALLLDEPLGALDAILRVSVREELDSLLTSMGITAVIVTHDQEEALGLGDLIAVMRDGRVEQFGTPEEIYDSPGTSFVAAFVGGSNRLPGSLEGEYLRLPGQGSIRRSCLKPSKAASNGARNVSVFFRPDRARICQANNGGMNGTVVSSHFIGRMVRMVVNVEDNLLKLELPARDRARPGSLIGVEVPPEAIFMFGERE
jgi:putative spermidine/putrescine transport system ATP-binding protein